MMVGTMRWFSKFVSEVMNSKLQTLPPLIRSQGKWKFCICHCPMFVESNRTVPNPTIFIVILLGTYSSNETGVTPINYVWLNSLTTSLCFLNIVEGQFRCGWKRKLPLLMCLLKYYFFRLSSRFLFKSFQDLASRGMRFFWFWLVFV